MNRSYQNPRTNLQILTAKRYDDYSILNEKKKTNKH